MKCSFPTKFVTSPPPPTSSPPRLQTQPPYCAPRSVIPPPRLQTQPSYCAPRSVIPPPRLQTQPPYCAPRSVTSPLPPTSSPPHYRPNRLIGPQVCNPAAPITDIVCENQSEFMDRIYKKIKVDSCVPINYNKGIQLSTFLEEKI